MLDKHRELTNRMETYERELALKRKTVEETIVQVRKDLAAAAANIKQRTDELKKRMDPDRERLEAALAKAAEELRARQAQRATLGRSIATLKKAAKQATNVLTPEARARQEAQMTEMVHDTERLDQEMKSIRAHARLLKIKLLLIKL